MITANCPRCSDPFRVPDGEFPEDAYAICPWCQETFPVGEVLDRLPPMLQVLDADGQPMKVSSLALAAGAGALAAGAAALDLDVNDTSSEASDLEDVDPTTETVVEDHFAPQPEVLQEPAVQVDSTSETIEIEDFAVDPGVDSQDGHIDFEVQEDPNDTWEDEDELQVQPENPAPMRVSPAPTRNKKSGSGLRTVIGIVVGAAASLPIAAGLLWLIGHFLGYGPFAKVDTGTNIQAAAPAELGPRSRMLDVTPGRSLLPDEEEEPQTGFEEQAPEQSALQQIVESIPEMAEEESPVVTNKIPQEDSIELPSSIPDPPVEQPELAIPPNKAETVELTLPPETSAVANADPEPETMDVVASTEPDTNAELALPPIDDERIESPTPPPPADVARAESTPEVEAYEPKPDRRPAPSEEVKTSNSSEPEELVTSSTRARQMLEALASFEGDNRERLRRMLLTYAEIAQTCELAKHDGPSLRALATSIKTSPLLEDMGGMAPEWLNYSARQSEGIAMIGSPGANSKGQTLKLGNGKVVQILGDVRLPAVERLLVLGRIENGSEVSVVLADTLP